MDRNTRNSTTSRERYKDAMLQPIRPSLTLKCHMLKRQFHKKLPNEGEGVKQARVQMTWWKYPRLGNGKNELTEAKSILGSFLSVVVFHSSLWVLSPCHLTTSAPRGFVCFHPCSFFPSPFLGFFHHVITNSRANISGRDRYLPTDSNYPFEIIHSYQYLSISDTLVDVVWAVPDCAWILISTLFVCEARNMIFNQNFQVRYLFFTYVLLSDEGFLRVSQD